MLFLTAAPLFELTSTLDGLSSRFIFDRLFNFLLAKISNLFYLVVSRGDDGFP